ncbi:MAG: DMT family transporter [Anaerolineales bacterium]|nr:DMT family transporter [Anaerolineales bacterium]
MSLCLCGKKWMISFTWLRQFKSLSVLHLPESWLGWTLALTSTLAFSLATPLGKTAIGLGITPTTILVLRFGISVMLLVITLGLTAPDKLRVDRKGLLVIGGAGFINGFGVLSFFWSLTRLDASVATMIFSLTPLVVLAVLALGGEKLSYRHLVRLAIGLIGVYLLIGPGGKIDWRGVLLICGSMVGISIEFALIQWFARAYGTRTITLYVMTGMLTTIGIFWAIQGAPWPDTGWQGWLIVGVMGLVTGYFAWWAMFTAMRYIGGSQVILLTPLETLLSVIWSVLFLQERLSVWQWLGGIFILTSAMLAAKRLSRVK